MSSLTVSHPAAANKARATTRLRITVLRPRHDELAAPHGEGKPSLNQVQGVAAEFLEPPPLQDRQTITLAGGELFQLLRARNQPRRDIALAGADLEQQLEEIGDQGAFL